MSHNDSKRYYWLKLKEDFFDDDAIAWLEEQKNGKEYALFYLKLCLKALKNNGVLIRHVGDMLIPYDAAKLSEITRTDTDTVIVALELLQRIGLVQLQENGALYITQLAYMVGSETTEAARKRQYRKKLRDNVPQLSQKCPGKSTQEYRDKSIDSSSNDYCDNDLSEIVNFCQENMKVSITPYSFQRLGQLKDTYSAEWVMESLKYVADKDRSKWNMRYLEAVLNGWQNDGYEKPWEHVRGKGKPAEEKQQDNSYTITSVEDYEKHQRELEEKARAQLETMGYA